MNNQTKLEFRLVPTKGVASGKGFRTEWPEEYGIMKIPPTRSNEDSISYSQADSQPHRAYGMLMPPSKCTYRSLAFLRC